MVLGGALGLGFVACDARAPRHFAWQAWHLVTSTLISRGRRGTNLHLPSFCVVGVALMVLGGALGLGFVACDARGAAPLCMAGVALGDIHLEVFVLKGQPWLDAIPFGCWCHCWNVANFHLSDKDMVVFPRPRLSQLVPSDGFDIVLKLITSNEPPPVNIRVVIGKAAATSATYRPQPSTSPLYDFCELQTLMLRNLDRVQLRDVDLRCPDGPLAKRLRQRFYEMLHCNVKLGKRTLSEFRADESTSTYYLHVLVSSDGQRLTLRAKLLYDPVYLRVPVVEDGKVCPWNKPAFAEICEAIQHASV